MENILLMPRLGVNDEFVTLVEWTVMDGSYVKVDQEVAIIETTKETSELRSTSEGYIHFLAQKYSEVRVGDRVAAITDSETYLVQDENKKTNGFVVTEKAKSLIEKYNIDISQFDGINIIREKDILPLIRGNNKVERSKANDIIIVCGGGLAKMSIDLLRLNKAYNIHGLVDDNPSIGKEIMGVPYLGSLDELQNIKDDGYLTAVNANGSISIDNTSEAFQQRKRIFSKIKDCGYFLPTLIHPSAEIAPSAIIGEGTLVFENAIIGSEAQIGDDCIINSGAIISHDCKICNHSRVSPGAILAGSVEVGENCLIGMGVTIYLGTKIGNNVIIANGQNIVCDIPDNAIVK